MTNIVTTKSLLAKLLASENVTVEHGNYETASFDVKNRVLRLPIWKEMSGSLYDLMVLHEVGHALYTPEDGWHGAASNKGTGYKSFLNVVEDARIERKIKDKYPGGRKSFTDGYMDLIRKNFFGIEGLDPNELGLIDRINLYMKGGFYHDVEFSEEENEFVEKVSNTRTWEDVVRVTDELYEYAKDHESETDMSDHEFASFEFSDEDSEEDEENSDGGNEMNSDETLSETLDELNEILENRDLEAGEEKKEDSGSSSCAGEGEGESEEDGKSTGESSKDDSGESADSAKEGEGEGDKESNNYGPGAGRVTDKMFAERDGSNEPKSFTDESFRSHEHELVENSGEYEYEYATLPVADLDNIIIDYKEVHTLIRDHYEKIDRENEGHSTQIKDSTKDFVDFRNKNKKTVEYLAKEFEMKKAADAHSRTLTANSGIIDTSILHTYKYNEHIFKKINVTPDGKNHGLVMVVDWSGSMSRNIKGTIEQMMTLVMFAKRVNIPFEVFLFSDSYPSEIRGKNSNGHIARWTSKKIERGDLIVGSHHLINVFSSRMRARELHEAYINMTAIAAGYDYSTYYDRYYSRYSTLPDALRLGGTPLNDSLLAMNTFLPEFKAKNGVQVGNLIYLTDGDSNGLQGMWYDRVETKWSGEYDDAGEKVMREERIETKRLQTGNSYGSKKIETIIRDPETKKEYNLKVSQRVNRRGGMTALLVNILREKHGINVVNFFLLERMKRYDMTHYVEDYEKIDENLKYWRKNGHMIVSGNMARGWSELYLVKGGKDLQTEEDIFTVKEDATKGQIRSAFKKFSKGKLENRMMLSKFVDMVAA